MKSKVYRNLTIIAATAVPPCALLACFGLATPPEEGLLMAASLYLIAHTIIWLGLIPLFRKFPRTSWVLTTLLYPIITLVVLLLFASFINPSALGVGLLWYGPGLYIAFGWIVIPISGISATIAYLLTRNRNQTENNRGEAAPAT